MLLENDDLSPVDHNIPRLDTEILFETGMHASSRWLLTAVGVGFFGGEGPRD
jgi:hypothetical protein